MRARFFALPPANRLALLLLLLPCTLGAHDEPLFESWRWVSYTVEAGLPSNRIFDIIETTNHIIWARTKSGIAWYDGFVWHAMGPEQGLPNMPPRGIQPGLNGDLFVFFKNITFHGNENGFIRFNIPYEGDTLQAVHVVPVRRDEYLVAAATRKTRLFLIKNGQTRPFPSPDDGIFSNFFRTQNGCVWANTANGLYRLQGKMWAKHFGPSTRWLFEDSRGGLLCAVTRAANQGLWSWETGRLPRKIADTREGDVLAMDIAPSGDFLVVSGGGEVEMWINGQLERLSIVPEPLVSPNTVRYQQNGDLWVGTNEGLFLYRHSLRRWDRIGEDESQRHSHISALLLSREGDLWIGQNDGILVVRENQAPEHITEIQGTRISAVTGLAEDAAGGIWVSSGSGIFGAYRWFNGEWRHFGTGEGLGATHVHKIISDSQERLWFLGMSDIYGGSAEHPEPGAFMFDGTTFQKWGPAQGLLNGRVYDFAEGKDGDLWFATSGGLSHWQDGSWEHFTQANGLLDDRVFALARQQDGRIWFGHIVLDGGLGFINREGKPEYVKNLDAQVWEIRLDANNNLWIGTDVGVVLYRNGAFNRFDAASGLQVPRVWPLVPTEQSVYVGTGGAGVWMLRLDELESPAPRLRFERPNLNGRTAFLRWRPFSYHGEQDSREVETRFKIDEGPWSAWSTLHETTALNLSPGQHEITVQAKSLFGNFTSQGSSVAFRIAGPFYLRPDFLVIATLWLIGMAAWAAGFWHQHRKSFRRLQESERTTRSLLDATTEIAFLVDEHGRIHACNQPFLQQMGKSEEEVLGADAFGLLPPHVAKTRRAQFQKAQQSRRPARFEDEENGRYFDNNIYPIFTESGATKGFAVFAQDVTDRKQAHVALQESETKFRTLAETTQAAIFIFQGMNLVYVNPAAEWVTGYSAKELLQMKFWEIIHPEHQDMVKIRGMQRLKGEPVPSRYEVKISTKKGEIRWVDFAASQVEFHGKRAVMGTALDISERKLVEEALRESERRHRAMLQAIPDLIFRLSRDGMFLDFSGPPGAQTYVHPEEFIGKNVMEVLPPELAEISMAKIARAIDSGETQIFEYPLQFNGQQNHWEARIIACGESEVYAIVREVTERKIAEQALKASEERFKQLSEAAFEGIAIHENGVILEANQRLAEMFGYSLDEFIGANILKFTAPESKDTLLENVRNRVRGPYEAVGMRKDGTTFPVEIVGRQVVFHGKNVRVAAVRDITKRKLAEAERENLITELESKNAELERFTYTVSHDLKSPLITIRGFAGLLEKDIAKNDAKLVENDLKRIVSAADNMQELLDELLELSRVGRVVNASEEVDMNALAREAINLLSGQIEERHVDVELASSLPSAFGDRSRLLEVLQNLIENAIKFMGEQPTPHVKIGAMDRERETAYYVRDNGKGIDPQYHDKIFGLFERLTHDNNGNGIGLALVKRIIELHGGRIWVESVPGEGASFYFTLPQKTGTLLNGEEKNAERRAADHLAG